MAGSYRMEECEFYALQMLEVSITKNSFSTPISCADVSTIGNLKSLNELAKQANAHHIIHTGDFGFYDDSSLERIAEKLVAESFGSTGD